MPFAAIGFASVVSIIPGVYLFRMESGLLEIASSSQATLELLTATFTNGLIAAIVILSMSVGLILPKMALDAFLNHSVFRTRSDPRLNIIAKHFAEPERGVSQ